MEMNSFTYTNKESNFKKKRLSEDGAIGVDPTPEKEIETLKTIFTAHERDQIKDAGEDTNVEDRILKSKIPSGPFAYFRTGELAVGKQDINSLISTKKGCCGNVYETEKPYLLNSRLRKLEKESQNHDVITLFSGDKFATQDQLFKDLEDGQITERKLVVDIQGISGTSDSMFLFFIIVVWMFAFGNLIFFSSCIQDQALSAFSSVISVQMLLVGLCGMVLTAVTNDSSISAMVSQRWNPICYLTILVVTIFATTIATSLVAGTIGTKKNGTWPITALMPISVILTIMILIFPLPVNKTAFQLGMVPMINARRYAHHVKNFDTKDVYTVYKLQFLDLSPKFLELLHYLSVGVGYISGVIGIITYIKLQSCRLTYIIVLTILYSIVAFIFAVLFLNGKYLGLSHRSVMASEVIFLICHFMSIICILYITDGIFNAFDVC